MMRLVAFLAALCLATAVHAGPANFLATTGAKSGGISPQNGNYTGKTPSQANTACFSCASVTFGSTVPAGHLVVCAGYWSGSSATRPVSGGWTTLGFFNSGAAGLPRTIVSISAPGGTTTFTPFSDGGSLSLQFTGCVDAGTATFQTLTDNLANSQGPSTTTTTTTADNQLAIAFSWEFASGATFTAPTVTGNITTGPVTAPGTPVITVSYGTFRYNGGAPTCTVQGNWTGGAGASNTGCDVVVVQ